MSDTLFPFLDSLFKVKKNLVHHWLAKLAGGAWNDYNHTVENYDILNCLQKQKQKWKSGFK